MQAAYLTSDKLWAACNGKKWHDYLRRPQLETHGGSNSVSLKCKFDSINLNPAEGSFTEVIELCQTAIAMKMSSIS